MFKPIYIAGEKPSRFQLLQKDIGVNLVDKIFFFKNLNQEIVEIGTGTSSYVESSSGFNTIKLPDGTLIITIPTFLAEFVNTSKLAKDFAFPTPFITTDYSVSLDIIGRYTFSAGNAHKTITEVSNKTVESISLGVWSEVTSLSFTAGNEVEMSATLTGRWK